jgi:hypothetical protein
VRVRLRMCVVAILVGGRRVKSVACESGMTWAGFGTCCSNLRNHFGRFAAFGEACRRSRSRASMCNDFLFYGREVAVNCDLIRL